MPNLSYIGFMSFDFLVNNPFLTDFVGFCLKTRLLWFTEGFDSTLRNVLSINTYEYASAL